MLMCQLFAMIADPMSLWQTVQQGDFHLPTSQL